MCADDAGGRIDVAGGAVIVVLGAVRMGLLVGLHVGARIRRIALYAVAVRVRARAKIADVLGLRSGGGQRQRARRRA